MRFGALSILKKYEKYYIRLINMKNKNEGQKCYIWLNDVHTEEPIAIIYGCYFPVINERIILWNEEGKFENYKVTDRIFGINKEQQSIVLNIYVNKLTLEQNENN